MASVSKKKKRSMGGIITRRHGKKKSELTISRNRRKN